MDSKKMKFVKLLLSVLLLLLGIVGNAQEISISGTVNSSDDAAGLPGVNIAVKGTSTGTITDLNGSYSLTIPNENAVLVFSYLGYLTQEIKVGNKTTIDITLAENADELDEVVVIGYGTVKKSDITGSLSQVKSDDLTAYPVLSAEQALQGRSAGVVVQSNNGGEPGAPIKIRIRGGTSINASSDALVVVDGFVGASMPAPEDIASMEILKDASATAIYGSQGSNGVILVSTKRGQVGKLKVEFNSSFSSQKVNNTIDMLNADQFGDYVSSFNPSYVRGTGNTDWQDIIYRAGDISNTQLAFSGANDNVKYYISGNYYTQNGVIINSGLQRYTILSNVDLKVSDKVNVGLSVFGGRSTKEGVLTQSQTGGAGASDAVSAAYRFAPDLGIYDANGEYTINTIGDDIDNPFAAATENVNDLVQDKYRANFNLGWEIIKGLDFRTSIGYSVNNDQTGTFKPTTLISGAGVGGEATVEGTKRTNVLNENYLTYKKEIGKNSFTLMGGYSYQKVKREYSFAGARGFVTNSVSYRNLGGGSVFLKPESSLTESELVSFFGRVNYDFDSRYLLTFTARRDGSSNFSENNKYAFFPSGALAWNMGNEAFLKDNSIISNWKWRASYGATGNPSISPYGTLARFSEIYSVIGDNVVNAVAVTVLANSNLKWETSYQMNLGIDIGFFKNRLNLTFDYYKINTVDLLFNRPLPEYVGLANPVQTQNIGELENRGYEFTISSVILSKDDFTWSGNLNISTNKNKMLTLPSDNEDILINSTPGHFLQSESQILRVGEPIGSFYGFIYDGVIQEGQTIPDGFEDQPGGELFRDVSGDGIINSEDKTIIGDPTPDFTIGFSNDLKYKNFDLNLFIQGSVGGEILNYSLLEMGSGSSNATTDALNSWSASNTTTDVPSPAVRTKRISSRYVYDGSYVRLKNISLGYSLPVNLISKIGFTKARLYVSAQNLITFTKYPGADPEVNYRNNSNERSNTNLGLDYGSYPNVKTFTMGVNLTF